MNKFLLASFFLVGGHSFSLPLAARKVGHEATSLKVMVASQNTATTAAGIEVFQDGGNIVDAATAMTFTLSVERPQSMGIGEGDLPFFI